jgi:hypothetical protein
MPTAQTIINKSLRMLGVVAAGESATGQEIQDAFDSLNSVIDAISADPSLRYTQEDEAFTLTASKAAYCIGDESVTITSLTSSSTTATATTAYPHSLQTGNKVTVSGATETNYNVTASVTVTSPTTFTYTIVSTTSPATGSPVFTAGDFHTARPVRIVGAFTRAGGTDSPLGLISENYWNNIADKSATAAVPINLLYRPNFPFGQIIIYKVPTGTPELHIKSEKMISEFASLTSDQPLPPGYRRMLELSLAVDVAGEYGARVPQQTADALRGELTALVEVNRQRLISSKLQTQPSP